MEKSEKEWKEKMKTETATFGAGCFWHVEKEFSKLKGVVNTTVGYMGGNEKEFPNPTYEQVHSDKTGFAEVCKVEFDPNGISYNDLLKVFWGIHNPTQENRQGMDFGSQYRSVIFYYNEEQKELATRSKEKEQTNYKKEIVTEIMPAEKFHKAEEYHQKYLIKKGKASCGI